MAFAPSNVRLVSLMSSGKPGYNLRLLTSSDHPNHTLILLFAVTLGLDEVGIVVMLPSGKANLTARGCISPLSS